MCSACWKMFRCASLRHQESVACYGSRIPSEHNLPGASDDGFVSHHLLLPPPLCHLPPLPPATLELERGLAGMARVTGANYNFFQPWKPCPTTRMSSQWRMHFSGETWILVIRLARKLHRCGVSFVSKRHHFWGIHTLGNCFASDWCGFRCDSRR